MHRSGATQGGSSRGDRTPSFQNGQQFQSNVRLIGTCPAQSGHYGLDVRTGRTGGEIGRCRREADGTDISTDHQFRVEHGAGRSSSSYSSHRRRASFGGDGNEEAVERDGRENQPTRRKDRQGIRREGSVAAGRQQVWRISGPERES